MPETSEGVTALEEVLKAGFAGFTVEKILTALLSTVICLVVIKILMKLTDRAMRRVELESTIKKLIRGGIKALLLFLAVIVVMGCLDIPVTSLVAVLSVVGLAFSLALQNFLSNVAGGLQLLASQPFKVGDFVEAGACSGTVAEIGLFYTKLRGIDNRLVQLPNSTIVSSTIINYSSEELRRVELRVTASYDAPTDQVRQVLARLVGEHPLTLATPEPLIRVSAYQESAIEYIIRVWCANEDYWTVYYDLLENIKPAFDQQGIEMTYPHLNVHMMDLEGHSAQGRHDKV